MMVIIMQDNSQSPVVRPLGYVVLNRFGLEISNKRKIIFMFRSEITIEDKWHITIWFTLQNLSKIELVNRNNSQQRSPTTFS